MRGDAGQLVHRVPHADRGSGCDGYQGEQDMLPGLQQGATILCSSCLCLPCLLCLRKRPLLCGLGTWHAPLFPPPRPPHHLRPPAPLQVGTCSALSGLCTCPAGWTGFNCLHPMKRYCTHVYREFGFEVPRVPPNLTAGLGPSGITTFQFTKSHCAGEQAVYAGRQTSRQTGRACPALQQAAS